MRTANPASKEPALPGISLPKGGGAIPGMGEKFQSNAVTGAASFSIPLKISPGRAGFTPALALSYDSGAGNTAFGLGWNVGVPFISRKTQKGIPRYDDDNDTFLLSGAEDLVPLLDEVAGEWKKRVREENGCSVVSYRPRIESSFARIEKWQRKSDGVCWWKVTTKENGTSIYGNSNFARISDPGDERKVFQWMLEKSYDDKGNCMLYEYKREDDSSIVPSLSEKNRLGKTFPNRYLKRVKYGNTIPVDRLTGNFSSEPKWLFEVVLDYGEHGEGFPEYEEIEEWSCRRDPFSSYRSGFEIRTYRLCKRILQFHHFAALGDAPYLVSAVSLEHEEHPVASLVKSIQHFSYEEQLSAAFPPVTFTYTLAEIDPEVKTIAAGDVEKLPGGVDGSRARWTDLFGEGLTGILVEDKTAWWYKRNVSALNEQPSPVFREFETVALKPSLSALASKTQELTDLDGDGNLELVIREKGAAGYFEKNDDGDWETFHAFLEHPNVDWNDPNLRWVDLTGDGHADLLVTEENCFTWYASKTKEGYALPCAVEKTLHEEQGPDLVFSDGTQSIYLADMSGDGLNDLVRIRNGSVCYWPNKGYGRFGAKVSMENAPFFDHADLFEQKRIRIGDIDGTGTSDLVYVGADTVRWWTNQSGNGFSEARTIAHHLPADALTTASVIDLLGKGTSCIVFSDPLAPAFAQLRYVDLLSKGKPYLLSTVDNNCGALHKMQYAPSTKFYLQAEQERKPWISRLPFPVHVLEKTEMLDAIEQTRFTTRYAYHHGYYDTHEREFRGFGLVEQWDTEEYNTAMSGVNKREEFFVPPVYTKSWFHTGFYREKSKMLRQYEQEYYHGDAESWTLPDAFLPGSLSLDEIREAHRALKGSLLRQEVYAQDGSEKEAHPYSVIEHRYALNVVQPKNENQFASFLVLPAETLTYHYERNPADPRIQQQLTLETDRYGTVLRSAAIAYPRRQPEFPEQGKTTITVEEKSVTHLDTAQEQYRLGVPVENKTYELTGIVFTGNAFTTDELRTAFSKAKAIAFEEQPAPLSIQKRIIEQQRITYYTENAKNELPAGEVAFHALPYLAYTKAFTPGLIDSVYAGRVTKELLLEAGYVEMENDWWQPSGRIVFDPLCFYQPAEAFDPLGNRSMVEYDAYFLFPVSATDALGSVSSAVYDYRVLQAQKTIDINGNFQEVRFDVRGMVIATAVSGKNGEGDTLGDPTTKLEYELFNWMQHRKPNFVKTMTREKHAAIDTLWQVSYSYSNGLEKEILKKVQAEDGMAFARDENGTLKKDAQGKPVKAETTHRWIGNGRIVMNNKGKPVKQYEPYFTDTPEYEDETELREYGVTPVLHYDPVERVILTDLPDGTFTKVEFDAWKKSSFDANDTVLESEWYFARGAPESGSPEPHDPEERAAWLAAQHADTPLVVHLDALGREFLTIADNGAQGKYSTHIEFDVEGKQHSITDAKGRVIARYAYDVANKSIYSWMADAGERRTFYSQFSEEAREEDKEPKPLPLITWDSRAFCKHLFYDALHRLSEVWLTDEDDTVKLIERIVYGEAHPDAASLNLFGKAWLSFDQSGMNRNDRFDFKGNPLEAQYRPAAEYKHTIDWQFLSGAGMEEIEQQAAAALESDVFNSFHQYDALNRIVSTTHPDGTEVKPGYNKAGLLEKISARLKGGQGWTEFVSNIDYNEKAQRTAGYYGNGTKTSYRYDENNFHLTRLFTTRKSDNAFLQDLHYTYDPSGNITEIRDEAQQTVFFSNAEMEPVGLYEYDALYRLVKATGRELTGMSQTSHTDCPLQPLPQPGNVQALRMYTQTYSFDELGNILSMTHKAAGGNWKRNYRYKGANNHLLETSRAGEQEGDPFSDKYVHDAHGNMTQLPHLQNVVWNFHDQMKEVDLGGGGIAYYVYNSSGHRTRKVIERNDGAIVERFYVGGFEIFRERRNEMIALERQTLFIGDDKRRVAQVDALVIKNSVPVIESTIRYQYSNHLGSAALELDEAASIISYEEYHPFGTSAYRSGKNETEAKLKRYRYSGKERDEETGLYYYGARHLIAWLGRWNSSDPAGFVDGLNLFQFVRSNPVNLSDVLGLEATGNPEDQPKIILIFFTGGTEGGGHEQKEPIMSSSTGPVYAKAKEIAEKTGRNVIARTIAPGRTEGSTVPKGVAIIEENYKPGDQIIIYGYSYGGDSAVNLAEEAEDRRIPIDTLITVDSTDGPWPINITVDETVPTNVTYALNIYQTVHADFPILSRGYPHRGEGANVVENVDATRTGTDHYNIQQKNMQLILDKIQSRIDKYSLPPLDLLLFQKLSFAKNMFKEIEHLQIPNLKSIESPLFKNAGDKNIQPDPFKTLNQQLNTPLKPAMLDVLKGRF